MTSSRPFFSPSKNRNTPRAPVSFEPRRTSARLSLQCHVAEVQYGEEFCTAEKVAFGQRRATARYPLARSSGPHRHLEAARGWPLPGPAPQPGRRRARRPCWSRRRASRGLRLSDRVLSTLATAAGKIIGRPNATNLG